MTRRERLERKLEQRRMWAESRRERAAEGAAVADRFRGDHAFNTQPGHIPERARVIRTLDRAYEDEQMAQHHDAKAAGLAGQLDRSVFSDDTDAAEKLEARIKEHEAKRDRMKLVNHLYKQADAAGLAALGIGLDRLKAALADAGSDRPHLSYEFANLGARIRADRERLKALTAQRARAEQAKAGGGIVIEGNEWVRVTFAEKPVRAILDALKMAGFHWGAGSWVGERVKLPAEVVSAAAREGGHRGDTRSKTH